MTLWIKNNAWPWIKKNWLLLVGALGAAASILLLRRKPADVVAPELVKADEAAAQINGAADKAKKEADAEEARRLQDIVDAHSVDVALLTDEQRKRLPALVNDQEELNSFLLEVGKTMRSK